MSTKPKPFVVSALFQNEPQSETRGMAPSAMVLAGLWADRGCEGIVLTDRAGREYTRDSFRALLCAGKKARRALA